ncbi:hypothetical protein EVJ58_g10501 [Rhodofomes roseus]|uniref:Uncharacterized protein n=1 Tax=Rhodofomes roseus TaxID=34475 RepID=A0A4Y9XN91_9APHY|nr:hypothetical protein EVJ58_g10501 [Rhodofomes roseus]
MDNVAAVEPAMKRLRLTKARRDTEEKATENIITTAATKGRKPKLAQMSKTAKKTDNGGTTSVPARNTRSTAQTL